MRLTEYTCVPPFWHCGWKGNGELVSKCNSTVTIVNQRGNESVASGGETRPNMERRTRQREETDLEDTLPSTAHECPVVPLMIYASEC